MGVGYILVNYTKLETVHFFRLPVSTAREIAGVPSASAVTTWYLLKNRGDTISFVPDTGEEWPFPGGSSGEMQEYQDQTEQVINELIAEGILVDCGFVYQDEDDPSLFLRDLRNSWMPEEMLLPSQKASKNPQDTSRD